MTLLGLVVVIDLGLGLLGVEPYLAIAPIGFGLCAVAVMVIMALASAAVVKFFWRDKSKPEAHWWSTLTSPILATVLLTVVLVAELRSFALVTGSEDELLNLLPLLILAAFVGGVGYSRWLKVKRPAVYALLSEGDTAEKAAALRAGDSAKPEPRSTEPDESVVS